MTSTTQPAVATEPSEPPTSNDPKEFRHNGFALDFRIGTQGCVRQVCSRSSRHRARPGVRLDGFLGGNIRGWVDLGFSGGWGTLGSRVEGGTNALNLYGIDTAQLEQAAAALGSAFPLDLDTLAVVDSTLTTARFGPALRVHFIPKGRFDVWVGSGFGYSLFRARYATRNGDLKLDFHGIDVPIEAGFGVFVHKNIAVGVSFNYLWSRYLIAHFEHPDYAGAVPIGVLTDATLPGSDEVLRQLPHLWTVQAGVRFRFGGRK